MNASAKAAIAAAESLVVLTHDDVLLGTLQSVVTGHEIATVGAEADLAAHLIEDRVGVAVIDTAAVTSPIARFTERLKAQFPDLVLVVAGTVEDQSALGAQITNGTVYRFLHKPVSEQRVKLFVEAAWRRHNVEHAGIVESAAAAVPAIGQPTAGGTGRAPLWIAVAVAVVVVAGGALWLLSGDEEAATSASVSTENAPASAVQAPEDPVVEELLARADAAYKQGALVAPPQENAADLYRQVLERNGNEQRARDGLETVMEQLLTLAEQALLEERTDDAERHTEAARSIQPDHVRVAFLTAQIGKERERALLAQARRAAESGNVEEALAVLDSAARGGQRSTLVAEARNQLQQQQVDDRVQEFLRRAANRMRSGQLVEPAQDNARFFIESARALAPNHAGVRRAQQQLTDRVLASARTALEAGDADEADRWIEASRDVGVSRDEIAALTRESQRVRIAARAEAMARLSQSFNQRLAQNRLVEPANDSAKFYLTQLAQADPEHPSTQQARQALNARLLEAARNSASRQDFAGAQRWLSEARQTGAEATAVAALERELATAQETAQRASEVINANSVKRVRTVEPEYPALALERGTTGWVDLEFTIRADGTVGDVRVVNAEPAGVFDQAAMSAARRWRYEPIVRDGRAVDQRATVRIRFTLGN